MSDLLKQAKRSWAGYASYRSLTIIHADEHSIVVRDYHKQKSPRWMISKVQLRQIIDPDLLFEEAERGIKRERPYG